MAVTGVSNYNIIYEDIYASPRKEVAKKEETKETTAMKKSTETAKKGSNKEYLKSIQKQIPYIKLQIGYGVNTKNDSKADVLDINPKLLGKMQNDPKAAKEYTQQLKDVESAHKYVDNFPKATGSTVICSHAYVDENGIYCNFTVSVRKDALNEERRKEAQENAEKRIEKSRENARENAEQLTEKMEEIAWKSEKKQVEKRVVKEDEKAVQNKAEQLLEEKTASSKDSTIYLYDTDMKTIIEVAKEDNAAKANESCQKLTVSATMQADITPI